MLDLLWVVLGSGLLRCWYDIVLRLWIVDAGLLGLWFCF